VYITDSYLNIVIVPPGDQGIVHQGKRLHGSRLVAQEQVLGRNLIAEFRFSRVIHGWSRTEIDFDGILEGGFEGRRDIDHFALGRVLRNHALANNQYQARNQIYASGLHHLV
jgi:hypothetical protein